MRRKSSSCCIHPSTNPEITSPPADADARLPTNSPFQETWLHIDVPPDAPTPARNQVKEIEEDIMAELVSSTSTMD